MKQVDIVHDWEAFQRAVHLQPPSNDEELERLHRHLDAITDAMRARGDDLEHSTLTPLYRLLVDMAYTYEQARVPAPAPVAPRDMLEYLLEEHGLSQSELARQLGISATTINKVIAGEREVSKKLAMKLAARFHVSPALFLTR